MPNPATPYEWDISGSESVIDSYDAIENAIHDQIVLASGLDPTKVIWDSQSRERPPSDFIDLNISELETLDPATNEEEQSYDANRPNGSQIQITTVEDVELKVMIQYYAVPPSGKTTAHARLAAVRTYLGREDVTDALWEDWIGLTNVGAVKRIPKVLEAEYESRAMFEATFRFKLSSTQFTTWIEHVNAKATLTGTQLPSNFDVKIM